MRANKLLKKNNIYFAACLVLGLFLLLSGIIMYYNESTNTLAVNRSKKYSTGDSFHLEFNNSNAYINPGDTITLSVRIEDINISSGDKGIGALSFKLDYDTNAFTFVRATSSNATVTNNTSTKEFVLLVNNGNTLTSDSQLFTLEFTSNSSYTESSSNISLKDIYGSGGTTIPASDVSTKIYFGTDSIPTDVEDTTPPTISFSQNGNTAYEKSVSSTVTVEDPYLDLKSTKYLWTNSSEQPTSNDFGASFNSGDTLTKSTISGEYRLCIYAKDLFENENILCTNTFKIDGARPPAPQITSTIESNSESADNIIITISGSSAASGIQKYQYSLNNGNSWEDYDTTNKLVISEEGVTTVIARAVNNMGVEGVASAAYLARIAKPNMLVSYSASTSSKTNQDVLITVGSTTQLRELDGWTLSSDGFSISKLYSQNDIEQITVTDIYDNTSTITVVVNQIDKIAPELDVSYNKQKDYVEVTVKADEKLEYIPGWNISDDQKSMTKVFYKNATENLSISDLAGNITTQDVKVDSLTNTANTNVSYDLVDNDTVKVSITSDQTLNTLSGWTISSDKKTLSKEFTKSVDTLVNVTTESGKSQSLKLLYKFLDDDLSLEVNYSQYGKTLEDVVVTITSNYELQELEGWSLSSDKLSLTKIYQSNRKEKITINSVSNGSKSVEINVDNIDKVAPEILNVVNNGIYPSIKLVFNKEMSEIEILKNKQAVNFSMEDTDTITEEGNYDITLTDDVGNTATYNLTVAKDAELTNVPNTAQHHSNVIIILGLLELAIGVLILFKFKVNEKANIAIIIGIIVISSFGRSAAATKTPFELNGYTVKNNSYLYGVEATTTLNDMKKNFDSASSYNIDRTSGYVSTGDQLSYDSKKYKVVIAGDVAKTGIIDSDDVTAIQNYISSNASLDNEAQLAANYNNDSQVDVSDLYLVSRRVSKNNYVIEPKSIKVDTPSTVKVGAEQSIKTTIYPSNASKQSVGYKMVSGTTSSKISNGKIKGVQGGKSTLRVSYGNIHTDVSFTVTDSHKMHFVNLYTGDCIILESNGKYGMIDTGQKKDKLGNKPMNYIDTVMNKIGADSLDFLMITHNHSDHTGNAIDVIKKYHPKTLYIKRYSYKDDADSQITQETRYEDIIKAALENNVNIKVIGAPSNIGKYTSSGKVKEVDKNNQLKDSEKSFKLGAFKIKMYNTDDAFAGTSCEGIVTENLNSLTQSVSITINGNTMKAYLEGDLSKMESCKKTYNKKKISVKQIALEQVIKDYTSVDIYKAAHHGYGSSTRLNEVKSLKPKYIVATSSQESMMSKEVSPYCAVAAFKEYLTSKSNTSFKNNFRTTGKAIEFDFTSGSIKMSGGAAWDENKKTVPNYAKLKCPEFPSSVIK